MSDVSEDADVLGKMTFAKSDFCGSRTFAQFEEVLGEKIANRAEVLAAMDCLMHHLRVEDHLRQWSEDFPDDHNWNILDWDPGEGAFRTESYMNAAAGMDDKKFEQLVFLFATIVSVQCFSKVFREGVFSYESSMGKRK